MAHDDDDVAKTKQENGNFLNDNINDQLNNGEARSYNKKNA